jgi:hypothetical protein
MKEIPLTQGKVALVDDEDYERVMAYKWYAAMQGRQWYALRKVQRDGKQTTVEMHRFILDAGDSPLQVDHINGNGLDNRRVNLRLGTRSENQRNSYKHRAGRLPGTYLMKRGYRLARPWQAQIWIDGRMRHLGCFATAQEAHERFLRADFERSLALDCWAAL